MALQRRIVREKPNGYVGFWRKSMTARLHYGVN
jgi:hypothetical protein